MTKHTLEGGEVIHNVHDLFQCFGRPCPIHNLSNHSMRAFPQHFRGDRGIMERICPHGIGHPDPDDEEYQVQRETNLLQSQGPDEFPSGYYRHLAKQTVGVHGCDGCCASP
jgi:hypothetical protein